MRWENTLLNTPAICALIVAVVPKHITGKDLACDEHVMQLVKDCPTVPDWASRQPDLPIHFAAAAVLLILLGIVAWQCACHSLSYLPANQKHREPMLRRAYCELAVLMFLCPVTGFALAALLARGSGVVFFVEMTDIWTFGAYWALKTWRLSPSRLERDPGAAVGNMARDTHGARKGNRMTVQGSPLRSFSRSPRTTKLLRLRPLFVNSECRLAASLRALRSTAFYNSHRSSAGSFLTPKSSRRTARCEPSRH